MITFHKDTTGVWVSKEDTNEFNTYVMTTESIVDKLILSEPVKVKTFDNLSAKHDMLTAFFDNFNRDNLKIARNDFEKLSYGYGLCGDDLATIIMWFNNDHKLSFAQYVEIDDENGTLRKLMVTDGDVYIKERADALKYRYYFHGGRNTNDTVVDNDTYSDDEIKEFILHTTINVKKYVQDVISKIDKIIADKTLNNDQITNINDVKDDLIVLCSRYL